MWDNDDNIDREAYDFLDLTGSFLLDGHFPPTFFLVLLKLFGAARKQTGSICQ
jgi:hypothetical protein